MPTMMYCYIHTGRAKVERAENIDTGKYGDTEALITCWCECKTVRSFMETVLTISHIIKDSSAL